VVADDSTYAETNAESGRGAHGDPVVGWIHALLPGVRGEDPPLQVHRFDEHTVVLRQEQGAGDQRWARSPRRSG
jgi:hypothetical protein